MPEAAGSPRVLLFTGKGGVGKSTLSAGTAALAAAGGARTLVLSTDAAHSLADAYGVPVGAEPTQVAERLFVQQVDAQLRFEQSWAEVQRYLLSVLDVVGVDRVAAEELTVLPGAEEVLALLELRLHARSGRWDVVVVDCAPTAETLRLLALPEALGWYMQRIFPTQRRVMKTLKPVLTRAAGGVPMPGETVFDALERLHAELQDVRELLTGPRASVRIVTTPERVVLAEARRSYTMLSLFGYRVDGVLANRVFPSEGADAWRAGWAAAQAEVLEDTDASFRGLPVWRSAYRPAEPVGPEELASLVADVYAGGPPGSDPFAAPTGRGPYRVENAEGTTTVVLTLPLVERRDVALARNGDELVVTVGSYRRLLTLPGGLARHRIAGARVERGELRVRFEERTGSRVEERVT